VPALEQADTRALKKTGHNYLTPVSV
jgi:hypothetical protein